MPRVLLFRHAKAERTQTGSTDHERALTKSGRKDAAAMGTHLAEYGPVDLVLCSTARRAKETWEAAAGSVANTPEVRFLRAIYDAESYVPILEEEGDDAATVLLVGHNPAMHTTAVELAANLRSPEGMALSSRFPKAALAVLQFDGHWSSLRPAQASIEAFILRDRS